MQKAADSILAAFLLRPLEGREEPNEALKRPKFIRWMNFSERRDDALVVRKCPVDIFSEGARR